MAGDLARLDLEFAMQEVLEPVVRKCWTPSESTMACLYEVNWPILAFQIAVSIGPSHDPVESRPETIKVKVPESFTKRLIIIISYNYPSPITT